MDRAVPFPGHGNGPPEYTGFNPDGLRGLLITVAAQILARLRAVRPSGILLLVVLVMLCVLLVRSFSRPSVRIDGMGYYAPLASVVFDRDLDLGNEVSYAHPWNRKTYFTAADGRAVDPYAVGAAFLWAPAMYASYLLDPARPTYRGYKKASPGFQPRYLKTIAWATGLEALLACFLLYCGFRPRTGRFAAFAGILGVVLGTPLVFYALAEPSYAHTASFLTCAALLVAVLVDRERRLPLPLLGALWGLAALVRFQDAVLGLMIAPRLLEEVAHLRHRRTWRTLGGIALFLVAAMLLFLPQVLFWQRIYGQPLLMTAPANFMRWGEPQVVHFLFSTWNGAFLWSPLFLLGFVGLVWLQDRPLRWALWGAVVLQIYACAACTDWWGSGGFAARRLTAVAPIAALGLALLVQKTWEASSRRLPRRIAVAALLLLGALWNLRLAQHNMASRLPFNPANRIEYVRHYPSGDPHRNVWGFWDYPRFFEEVFEAERRAQAR